MGDSVSFTHGVHEAFGRLYDRVYLKDHPLTRQLFGDGPLAVERLHRMLIDSLEWLRPLGGESPKHAEWRRYRHLQLRYVEGVAPDQIARELLVSARQARRDHAEALDELSRLLWERFVRAAVPAPAPPASTRPTPTLPPGDLESELSKMLASAGSTATRIDEVLRSTVETARPLAEDNHVAVDVTVEPDLPAAEISRPVLRQLLLNLLADAFVRHPGSTFEIRATRLPDAVDITIRLTGASGIPRALVSDEGLELARRLARSQNVGIQSTPSSLAEDAPRSVIVHLSPLSERTLLLVDDNPDVALLFRRFLANTSFRLVQARSAERALRLARETRPDVVVLDVLLPTTDGWEVLQALRADPSTAHIPVIVSSVLPDHALARSLGVIDFLPKPVSRRALLAALTQVSRDPVGVPARGHREASE